MRFTLVRRIVRAGALVVAGLTVTGLTVAGLTVAGLSAAQLDASAAPAFASPPARAVLRPVPAFADAPVVDAASDVSATFPGQNAEVQTAADPATGNLYEEWISGSGIGFARSTDGGQRFGAGFNLPGSGGGWDPAITVGATGDVYATFMVSRHNRSYPVVDISTDQGQTFPTVRQLIPARKNNWGDRDFIAVGPTGTIYVTWDYGPNSNITFTPPVPGGSGSFAAGDVNEVLQRSTNGGATWSRIIPISPGFPGSGADVGPILIEPDGRLDVLYQGYNVLNHKTLKLGVAHDYFTTSTDNGSTWSKPRRLGPASDFMNTTEWWIDGSLGMGSGKKPDLYATWDTQSGGHDIGWFSYSTTDGRTWSPVVRATSATGKAVHIVQVLGGRRRIAYVGWLTDSLRCHQVACYTQYLRVYQIGQGWITPVIHVSSSFGNWRVWPGDTIGLSLLPGGTAGNESLAVSWGSALGGRPANSEIWAVVVSQLP